MNCASRSGEFPLRFSMPWIMPRAIFAPWRAARNRRSGAWKLNRACALASECVPSKPLDVISRREIFAGLYAIDDRDSGARGRRAQYCYREPAAGRRTSRSCRTTRAAANRARRRSASNRRLRLWNATRFRAWTKYLGRAIATSQLPNGWSAPIARLICSPGQRKRWCFAASGNPAFIAADLLAQAEHDPDAVALFVTTSLRFGRSVAAEIARQLARLPKSNPAWRSVAKNGVVLVARNSSGRRRFVNRFAPEHLSLPGSAG